MCHGAYYENKVLEMFPVKRWGNPQEIANGIAWLCPDKSSYVTGHILALDAGFYYSLGAKLSIIKKYHRKSFLKKNNRKLAKILISENEKCVLGLVELGS